MPWLHALWIGLLGALALEALTVFLRFGLGWRSPERTRPLAKLTRGWRLHHGYPGLALMPVALPIYTLLPGSEPTWMLWIGPAILAAGIALAVSDLIHHALVLPFLAGSHEFELHYPGHPRHKPAPVTREPWRPRRRAA